MPVEEEDMRFLDANVLVYAFYLTKRKLADEERRLKEKARSIIKKIDAGEEVLITVVHLSEVSNILMDCYSSKDLSDLLKIFYFKPNIELTSATPEDYLVAIERSGEINISVNDCLALVAMEKKGINEIFTFDRDFERIPGIKVVRE